MSIYCPDCNEDLASGHNPDCPRAEQKKPTAVNKYRCPDCGKLLTRNSAGPKMSPEEAVVQLKALASHTIPGCDEQDHCSADTILCELLEYLGHKDVVDAYDNIKPKWYA